MGIEKEIGQKSFKSSVEKAKVNILYTNNWLRDLHIPIVKEVGLQMQHYNILRIARGKLPGVVTPGEIKEVMLDKGVDITRLVDKLVNMKLVSRETCPDNRRKVNIQLTEKGSTLMKELDKKMEKINQGLSKNITEEEADQLSYLLDKFRNQA